MSIGRFSEWRKLPVSFAELCINTTLRCGQSFRWQKVEEDEWRCTLHGRILSLRQDPTHLYFRTYFPPSKGDSSMKALPTPPASTPPSREELAAEPGAEATPKDGDSDRDDDDTIALIKHYFNLEPNLTELYAQWSSSDPNFKKKAPNFTGVRIMRQDAWEALIGFICSSNNNIARISQMVDKLCRYYGPLIGHIDGTAYHDFPSPSALTNRDVEARLRELGFGYRAKYIYQTAVMVANEREEGWLDSLRNPESPLLGVKPSPAGELEEQGREGYREAHEKLLELQGVGPKVADCVCLMGLGWGEAVPVDTHVWQIAQRDYKFGRGKHKSLTKATYDAVGDHFRQLWGKEAGWAHSVLFTADLRTFSERLTTKIEVDEKSVKVKAEMGAEAGVELTEVETHLTTTAKAKREASPELDLNLHEKVKVEAKIKEAVGPIETARATRASKRQRNR